MLLVYGKMLQKGRVFYKNADKSLLFAETPYIMGNTIFSKGYLKLWLLRKSRY